MSDYPDIYELSKKVPNRYELTKLVFERARDIRNGYPILNLDHKGIIETNKNSEGYLKNSYINIASEEIKNDLISLKEKEIVDKKSIEISKSGKISSKL